MAKKAIWESVGSFEEPSQENKNMFELLLQDGILQFLREAGIIGAVQFQFCEDRLKSGLIIQKERGHLQ